MGAFERHEYQERLLSVAETNPLYSCYHIEKDLLGMQEGRKGREGGKEGRTEGRKDGRREGREGKGREGTGTGTERKGKGQQRITSVQVIPTMTFQSDKFSGRC